jgi:Flp pilus assembly protein TadB
MRAQTLHNLTEGTPRFGEFLRLVFVRVIIVASLCLVVTLVIHLLSQGYFAMGSFLAGAAFGLGVFLIWNRLKHRFTEQPEQLTAAVHQRDELSNPGETRPRASVQE